MSLLSEAFEDFYIMNKTAVDDGYGGTTKEWTKGIMISGAMVMNSSTQQKIAESMGAIGAYTLTVRKNILLDFHDVLKRAKDGKYFRLVNDSDDMKTPNSAGLNMRQYSAEEWYINESDTGSP